MSPLLATPEIIKAAVGRVSQGNKSCASPKFENRAALSCLTNEATSIHSERSGAAANSPAVEESILIDFQADIEVLNAP
jgi:hypothetical protein